jgi:hypothetical protein
MWLLPMAPSMLPFVATGRVEFCFANGPGRRNNDRPGVDRLGLPGSKATGGVLSATVISDSLPFRVTLVI